MTDLTELYKNYCKQYGDNVITESKSRVLISSLSYKRRILDVVLNKDLSDEEILKGIGSIEISLKTDLQEGWELLAEINNKTYRSEKVELLHHNTLNKVLEPLGFLAIPRDWKELSCFDLLFSGSVADLEKLAQAGWIPTKLYDYTLPSPDRKPCAHHIENPLQPYRIQIVTTEPNPLVLYKPELACDVYKLEHIHHAPRNFLLQEHLPRLDEIFKKE